MRSMVLGFAIALGAGAPTLADSVPLCMASFDGSCKVKIVEGFFPCDNKVTLVQFRSGAGAQLAFAKDNMKFVLSSHRDRQPNLENYYASIDKMEIFKDDAIVASDNRMEGECHLSLNAEATEFYSLKCDIYDRSKGLGFSFYLEDIKSFDKKDF
jgi:hypothetical protein